MSDDFNTLEIIDDESDYENNEKIIYPGELSSKKEKLLGVYRKIPPKVLYFFGLVILLVFIFLLFIITFGTGIAIGSTLIVDNDCSSSDYDGECNFYSIDDFDSGNIPDDLGPNAFNPLKIHPLDLSWPDGEYHPLLSKEDSPEFVYRYNDDYEIDRNDISQRNLAESNEYQLKLNTRLFINRTQGIEDLLAVANQFLGNYISSIEDPVISYWYEIQYEKGGCGGDYSELRVRSYMNGKHMNSSSSSINKDCSKKKDVVKTLMYPGSNYIDNFGMKLEQDVHPCHYKYNRKLKVKDLPYNTTFSCSLLKEYYPAIFYDTSKFDNSPLEIHSNKTWWVYSQEGYLFNSTTKFKASCNVAYESEEDALSGFVEPNHSSEWSIRIYSFNDGYGVWDEFVLAKMGEFYRFMLDNYGSHGEDPDDC